MINEWNWPLPLGIQWTSPTTEDYDLALKSFAKAQESGPPVKSYGTIGTTGLENYHGITEAILI